MNPSPTCKAIPYSRPYPLAYTHLSNRISVLVARVLVTNFSAFSTWRTGHVAQYVEKLITDPGSPCGVDLFTTYFHAKTSFEVSNITHHLCLTSENRRRV